MQHPIKDSYIASLRVGVASRAQPTSLRLATIEIGDCRVEIGDQRIDIGNRRIETGDCHIKIVA